MPNAPATQTKAAPAGEDNNARDPVGEELADSARIWRMYERVAKEDDDRRTKEWDSGLNNLALFAGLFSAVTTAFIIEARHDMQPDYAQLTFLAANATSYGEGFVQKPFVIPANARAVTCLWVASLILSLSAALIAIMGKDWIGMYTARPVCNLRQWAEMRTYRLQCVEAWYMSGVIAIAPVLLHISLILFGAGLFLFISSDPLTQQLTLRLSLAAGGLYLGTTLGAVVFSTSPFKSPATQAARAAISALYFYISTAIKICAMVFRRSDVPVSLPGGVAENVQWYTNLGQAVVRVGEAGISYVRMIPTSAGNVRTNLHWSDMGLWLHAMVYLTRRLSSTWFFSARWTDLPADRRPELLADALSWLGSASQAPEVFRAIVFALGDLDIGPEVGRHTSNMLSTWLRAEIRRTWQQVDFLTLSRYVLADQNISDNPILEYGHFSNCVDLLEESALRCEDGLAAALIIHPHIGPRDVARYFSDHVTQPKMLGFMLPHLHGRVSADSLILLFHRYRAHLMTTNPPTGLRLEVHLYNTLDCKTWGAYHTACSVQYGGTAGPIELLTFLCCHDIIGDIAIPAAVELVMELLDHLPLKEHRCLAYLFGSSKLWYATWNHKHVSSFSFTHLSESLKASCFHPFQPSSVRTLSEDRQFDLLMARTGVMLFSPQTRGTEHKKYWIEFLCSHLCQSPLPGFPDNNEKLDICRLILDNAALLGITRRPPFFCYGDEVPSYRTAILAAILRDLGYRLCDPVTISDGEKLLAALAHTEVKGPGGKIETWDLREWLSSEVPQVIRTCPSGSTTVQSVHDALCALHPLCEHNPELRVHWDRIGYSGRPGDIFSHPFLNVGDFFASAEHPVPRLWR